MIHDSMRSMRETDSRRIEVLIAEDSPTQAEHLRYWLEENGCKVTVAKNGKDCAGSGARAKTYAAHQRHQHAGNGWLHLMQGNESARET